MTERAQVQVEIPADFAPERRYVLDVVLGEWLGVEWSVVAHSRDEVILRSPTSTAIVSVPDVLFGMASETWLTEAIIPRVPLPQASTAAGDAGLPVLFGRDGSGAAWTRTPDGLSLRIDVFGSIFFLLARLEELVRTRLDVHGRVPGNGSLADEGGFLERPLADEYAELLRLAMNEAWPDVALRRRPYRLVPTHDVDQPTAILGRPVAEIGRALLGDLVRRRRLDLMAIRAAAFVRSRFPGPVADPYDTFSFLMCQSERLGLRSTFFFLAGDVPGDPDFRYDIRSERMAGLLSSIHERGHEIGLHASYRSVDIPGRTRVELAALADACERAGFSQDRWPVRQHYLRFRYPETWREQANAGLAVDSTLGYADRVGFRAGTSREFPVFDALMRQPLGLRERPLIVMDATLFEYMGLGLDEALIRAGSVLEACRRLGGEPSVLYHNNALPTARERRHYAALLAALAPEVP